MGCLIIAAAILIAIIAIITAGKKTKTVNIQTTSSTEQQVSTWETKYGSIVRAIANDLGNAGNAGSSTVAMGNACQQLEADVKTAQADPAIPASSIEKNWSSSLSYLSSGSKDCVQGIENNNQNQINQAGLEFDHGTDALANATTALR